MLFNAVGGQSDGDVRLKALFHEIKELIAGLLHQLLGLNLAYQFALAFFQLGDDVGEVGNDALGVFVRVEQVVDFAVVEECGKRVQRVTRVAVVGAHVMAIGFHQRLGEQSAHATERVGGLERGLVDLTLQPAVVQQCAQHPARLLAVVLEATAVVVFTFQQGRAFQCFAEDIHDLLAP